MFAAGSLAARVLRCLALVVAAFAAHGALTAAETWLAARTAHFEMFSSASESESRRILIALEQFRANFLASFPLRGASEPRTTIVLFRSESQFRPYKPLYEGKPKAVAGYFLPGSDEVMIAMTTDLGGSDTDPTEVIFHEYVHLLLHAHEARVPVWLNEGLAELYSTFRVEGAKVEFGLAKDNHVAVLNQSALLPLPKLFAVTQNSPDYNEEYRAGIFYAQSWAFTHYLVCGADRANGPKLAKFIERLSGSGEAEDSFREAFGTDTKPMEQALRNYLGGGRYFKRTTPAVLQNLEVKFRPAADGEREFALLNLRWRMHHPADTAYRSHELLRQQPNAPRPHELLAAVAASEGDSSTAQEHWQRAAALNSDNAFVYVQLVREALSGFHGAAFLDGRLPPPRIAELRGWANRALALSADNADALELSALIETLSEELNVPAINRAQGQVLKMREPSRTLLALAIIRWRAGDPKTAADIIELILSQRRADMATRSAAGMLRTRLPAAAVSPDDAPATTLDVPAEVLASRAAVALQNGKGGSAAGAHLDRLLAERGTTAPRLKLPPIVATAPKKSPPEPDAWAVVDECRKRAAAGDTNAMFQLALAHVGGDGAEFSPSLALAWLEKAAAAGHEIASAGLPRGEATPDAGCEFLRRHRGQAPNGEWPPLDGELRERIAEALAATSGRSLTVAHRARPHFPEELRRAGRGGEVLLQFQVDAEGHPKAIRVAQASDAALASAAEECLRQWRFIPTIRDRHAVATEVEVPVRFKITD